MKKVLVNFPCFCIFLSSATIKTMKATSEKQFANYCGIPVIVERIYSTEYGTLALISYDDGREEEVPLMRLDLL